MARNPEYIKLINTYRWKTLRLSKLTETPTCERCKQNGKFTIATEVHHITPIESVSDVNMMKILAFDKNNLMSLCKTCHKQIHIEMYSRKSRQQVTDEYLEKIKRKFNF